MKSSEIEQKAELKFMGSSSEEIFEPINQNVEAPLDEFNDHDPHHHLEEPIELDQYCDDVDTQIV